MNRLFSTYFLSLSLVFTILVSCGTHKGSGESDFVALFNGENLDGWVGNKESYKAEDGMITIDPNGGGSGGNLLTEKSIVILFLDSNSN